MRSRAVTFANFLRQPYPYYFTQDNLGKLALAICVPAFLFVYLFEPFNVNPEEHKMAYFWISFIHVTVSGLVLYGCYSLANLLKIEEEKWTLGKEIAGLAMVLLFLINNGAGKRVGVVLSNLCHCKGFELLLFHSGFYFGRKAVPAGGDDLV